MSSAQDFTTFPIMDRMRWMILLMFLLLAGITASQIYWMVQSYNTGKTQLQVRVNTLLEQYALEQTQQEALSMLGGKLSTLLGKEVLAGPEGQRISDINTITEDSQKKAVVHNFLEKIADKYLSDTLNSAGDEQLKQHKAALQKLFRASDVNVPFEIRIINKTKNEVLSSSVTAEVFEELPLKSKRVNLGVGTREMEIGFRGDTLRNYTLRKMALVLAGNVILIILSVLILLYLSRALLTQKKLARLKDDFISNMTHELKTPVAAIQVIFEALDKYNFIENKATARQYLSTAGRELSRLSVLIDKILKTSLLDERGILADAAPVDIAALGREVAAGFHSVFLKHGIRFTEEYGQQHVFVAGDRDHLANVIYTLLDNACKYHGADPQVALRVAVDNGQVVLSVTDNGVGIPKEHREAIFDKFYRVPTGDVHNIKGHGLGLYYARQVVLHHRGEIYADSSGDRTVLTIKLPLYDGTI